MTITDERAKEIKRAVLERAYIIQNDKWCWYELCRYYDIRTTALLEALVGRKLSTLPAAIEGLREYQEMLEIRRLPNR